METKVREEVVSVMLSEILEENGVPNVSLLLIKKVPDIYALVRGVRIIIETKEEGQRKDLITQLEERINKNLCDLAVGLEYPTKITVGPLAPPTPKEVRSRLLKTDMTAICMAHGASEARQILGETQVRSQELPEFLATVSGQAMPESEMGPAIEKVREAITEFSRSLATLPNAEALARSIKEELEIGEE